MTKPTFEETYPIRSVHDTVSIGYNPIEGKWAAEMDGRTFVAEDWAALELRIQKAQQRAALKNRPASKLPALNEGTEFNPLEIHVPAWSNGEGRSAIDGAFLSRRAKVYWDAAAENGAGQVKVVKSTNWQGNWEAHKRWTAMGFEDLDETMRDQLVQQSVISAMEKTADETKNTALRDWLSRKPLHVRAASSHGLTGLVEIQPSPGHTDTQMLPGDLRMWNTSNEKLVQDTELKGWKITAKGTLAHGDLQVILVEKGCFSLLYQNAELVCNQGFREVLRLANVTRVAIREQLSPVAVWHGSCYSWERDEKKLMVEVLDRGASLQFNQILVGAVILTDERHRGSKQRAWFLQKSPTPKISPESGQVARVFETVAQSMNLADYHWAKAPDRDVFFSVSESDQALDALNALTPPREDADSQKFSRNQRTTEKTHEMARDQATLRRIYDRHLDGNPVTAEEAANSSARLVTWLDQQVAQHPEIVTLKAQCAHILVQTGQALTGKTGAPAGPKRGRSPR